MITDKKSLREYMEADLAASYVPKNALKRWIHKIGGNEQCVISGFRLTPIGAYP